MTPARFRWGLLLILVGTLVLLANMEVLNHTFWIDFVYLLPFLLIAIGIEKIFARTKLKFISYLTSVALVAGAFYVAFEGSRYDENSSFFRSGSIRWDGDDERVDIVDAELQLGNADLTIRDAVDELFHARFGEWSYKPRSSMDIADGRAEISLTSRSARRRFWGNAVVIDGREPNEWRLEFSRDIPLLLKCYGQDSDIHLNLATTPLRELSLDVDDANIYIKIGEQEPRTRISIRGYDSKLRLRVPQESGLLVRGADDPAYLEQIGLLETDEGFITEGFDSLSLQIRVDLDDNFRSLSIDFY